MQSLRLVKVLDWGDIMVKDTVLITGSINLGASPDASPTGNVITVKFGGKTIEPILVLGTDLPTNCRGIIVPYGSDITFKVVEAYNINIYYSGFQLVSITLSAGKTYTFKAIRDMYIKDTPKNTQQDEIAPT